MSYSTRMYGGLSDVQNKALLSLSVALGVPPEWLHALIQFESGWIPDRRAGLPYNLALVKSRGDAPKYARGLIQFIDSTAQGLGYADSLDLVTKNPTIESQLLGPVYHYLVGYKPFPTQQALFMAVFNPSYRYVSPNAQFNDSVKVANPGINTPQDYVNHVLGIKSKVAGAGGLLALVALGFFLYKHFSKRGKGGAVWL